jgi:hypothetical protein
MGYQKTTVEIDIEQLRTAQEHLHTRGVKDTVNAALREINRRAALAGAADYVLEGKLHVPDDEAWASWREPRS